MTRVASSDMFGDLSAAVARRPLFSVAGTMFAATAAAASLLQSQAWASAALLGTASALVGRAILSQGDLRTYLQGAANQANGFVQGIQQGIQSRERLGISMELASLVGSTVFAGLAAYWLMSGLVTSVLFGGVALSIAVTLAPGPSGEGISLEQHAIDMGRQYGRILRPVASAVEQGIGYVQNFMASCKA